MHRYVKVVDQTYTYKHHITIVHIHRSFTDMKQSDTTDQHLILVIRVIEKEMSELSEANYALGLEHR